MRKDMKDVVINVGRGGFGYNKILRNPTRYRIGDFDDLPTRLSMRRLYADRKTVSDRLDPLFRFLEKNVGRKWDDVYSEIARVTDKRSLRGFHLLDHVSQYVGKGWFGKDGELYNPINGFRKFYVHPITRCLEKIHRNKNYDYVNKYDATRKIIDADTQLHVLNKAWFLVKLGPEEKSETFPVIVGYGADFRPIWGSRTIRVRQKDVLSTPTGYLFERYKKLGVVAVWKRQISKKEKKQYGVK